MRSRMFVTAWLLCSVVLPVGTRQSAGCEPAGTVKFICGVVSPEDLVAVPRADWVIASGYRGGGVHLINSRDYTTAQVFPTTNPRERFDRETYASCPGPLDPAEKEKFSAHGLAVAQGAERVHTVYLVHHGFRESIEIFEIDVRPKTPTFTWIGCVVAPSTMHLNSVSPLPGGGFAANNYKSSRTFSSNSDLTSETWEWNATDGWKVIPGSESLGPNGLEASRDGRWLYVNLWPARKVMRISRGQTPVVRDFTDVSFQPDNIRWQADGSLLAAGQDGPNVQRVLECLRQVCPDAASVVARIDPQTLEVQEIIRYPATQQFRSSTAALQVGKEIWIGTVTGDRIARYPVQD